MSAPKHRREKKKGPAVATRASTRIPKGGGPILEKATKRMHERDALLGGNKNFNPFTILEKVPNSHISNVMKDLDIEVDNIDTQIETFRIEEKAREAVAEANYRSYLDHLKAKDAPQGEEALDDLALGIIDNTHRGVGMQASCSNSAAMTKSGVAWRGENNQRKKK